LPCRPATWDEVFYVARHVVKLYAACRVVKLYAACRVVKLYAVTIPRLTLSTPPKLIFSHN
jgi:hypothetical protein